MFEIPLFLLFLQIGFNAALNNRAYSKHQQIEHYKHSDKSNLGYRWGVNDENSDSEYDSQSDEEYDFKPFEPQRRNDLRYKTRPNLETASVGRMNTNNYANDSSSSLRSHPNYRRPYSGPPSLSEAQARKFHRKENEDSQTSLEGSNYKHASRMEEQPSYLEPLSPLFGQFNNGRGQNHKGNSFSDDSSPRDKFYAAFRSNSQNKRRNYCKEHSNNNFNTRKSSDGLSRGLKLGLESHKLKINRPSRGDNRKKYKLFPNEDNTGQLKILRLSSLEELNLESPSLRSRDQDRPKNRKSNSRNYLILALLPHYKDFSKLLANTLDELYLAPVNFRRIGSSSNNFNRRENDNLSAEEDNLSNLSDTSLEIPNSEIPLLRSSESANEKNKGNLKQHIINQAALKEPFDDDIAKTLVPYHEGKSRINSSDTELLRHDIQHPWDDILSPDTNKSVKGPASLELTSKSQLRGPEDKDEHTTDVLPLENPWIDTLSSKKKQNNTKLRSHDQNESNKNTRDVLPLEYPWIDTLSSKKKQNNTKFRSHDKTVKDSTDVLPLQYQWNDALKHNGSIRQKDGFRDKKSKRKSRLDKTTPEPIFVHSYLRNRKNKHSVYFRRSYDRFNDGIRLQRILNTPRSNRRVEDNQNLEVLPIAKEPENHKHNPKNFDPYEESSAVITFPSDRSAKRSSSRRVKDSPPLLTTTERPNHN